MRKYYTIAVAVIAAIAILTGCHKEYEPDQNFMNTVGLGLTANGQEKFIYNPVSYQLGYSETLKEFRIHNDDMNEYLFLTCSEIPAKAGQSIICDLKCLSSDYSLSHRGISFKVEQIASNGTVWLWCGKKNIGVKVKILN